MSGFSRLFVRILTSGKSAGTLRKPSSQFCKEGVGQVRWVWSFAEKLEQRVRVWWGTLFGYILFDCVVIGVVDQLDLRRGYPAAECFKPLVE